MKRILVTGNSGLLGQAIVKALNESDDYSPVLFKTNKSNRDIRNKLDCEEALQGVEGVIHLASCQSYRNLNEDNINDVNVNGTSVLRKTALKNGVKLIRWSEHDLNKIRKAWEEVAYEISNENPLFKKTYSSLQNFRKKYALWSDNAFLK